MMKTILAATAALALTAASAIAQTTPITFKDASGNVWTVTEGGNNAEVSKLHISPDAAKACPGLRVKLEASKLGPKMEKDQKFRGDKRWHIVCDRSPLPQQAAK